MVGKLLLASVLIGFVSAGPMASIQDIDRAGNTTCKTDPPVTPCVLAFFANLGFAGQNNGYPKNDSLFISALNNYLHQNDIAGWNNLRTWMNTFITCAGGTDNFNACVDWQVLMKLCYLPKLAAQLYDSQFRVLEYETGPAFKVITDNWFCIKNVDLQEGPVIRQCQQTFQNQQNQNPNNTCQNFGDYLNCVERPYVTHCGRRVGAVTCHSERIVYSIFYPDCANHVALHCSGAPDVFEKHAKLLR